MSLLTDNVYDLIRLVRINNVSVMDNQTIKVRTQQAKEYYKKPYYKKTYQMMLWALSRS